MSDKIKINLVQEKAKIKKMVDGKEKVVESVTAEGEPTYIRDDLTSLQRLLNHFDTSQKPQRDWMSWAKIRRKIYDCYINSDSKIELTIDEASFLKDFLDNFSKDLGKGVKLTDGEIITMSSILEQLPN
jgi:hypothetical protein